MRRKLGTVAAVTVLGALFGAMALSGASAGGEQELRLFAKTTEQTFLDLGEEGPSLGDQLVFHHVLRSGGERVGHSGGACTITSTTRGPQGESNCLVTLRLSDGQITTQGLVAPPTGFPVAFEVAITGGTGRYHEATGELHVVEPSEGRARLTLRLGG